MYMIAYRSYVLTVRMPVDLAYDRHAMLIQLQILMDEQYSLEMLKQIVPTAVAPFGIGGAADRRVKLPADDIVKIRALTRNVYTRWYDYVKRYSSLMDPDKNSPWKLEAMAKTMGCLRAHDIGSYSYSVGALLGEMFLLDKTLCYSLPPSSKTPTVGPMTSNAF